MATRSMWITLLAVSGLVSHAALEAVDVRHYGAKGDAVRTTATTVKGSTTITVRSTVISADVGKTIQVFSSDTAQDFIATISAVPGANTVTASAAPAWSLTNVSCTIGTQNTPAFQAALNAAEPGGTVYVPAGVYLCYPTNWLGGGTTISPILVIPDRSIRIAGDSREQSVILANGAWQLVTNTVQRGALFTWPGDCVSGTTNEVVFENLTFDGGLLAGNIPLQSFPARTTDGQGWDITHCAIVQPYTGNAAKLQAIRHCAFRHWRGEIIKGLGSASDGWIEVSDCVFADGNASGYNSPYAHRIQRCTFTDLKFVLEFYPHALADSAFADNSVTNAGLSFTGSATNNRSRGYLVSGNTFNRSYILGSNSKNLSIQNNRFINCEGGAIATSAAPGAGTDKNRNWAILGNTFVNCYRGIAFHGLAVNGSDMDTCLITQNTFVSTNATFKFLVCDGQATNVVVTKNRSSPVSLPVDWSTPPLFKDPGDNEFPPVWFEGSAGNKMLLTQYGFSSYGGTQATNTIWMLSNTSAPEGTRYRFRAFASPSLWKPILFLAQTNIVLGAPQRVLRHDDTIDFERRNAAWHELDYGPAAWRWASNAPASGLWYAGERIENINIATNALGWVCTATGEPGTWVALAADGPSRN